MWRSLFQCMVHHLENAEMTPQLQDDLMSFSFDKLRDVFENLHTQYPERHVSHNICHFAPRLFGMFEEAGMPSFFAHLFSRYSCMHNSLTQPFSEAGHISSTFQVDFDRMLCDTLEKYYSRPGFSLHLGSFLLYGNAGKPPSPPSWDVQLLQKLSGPSAREGTTP
jgi:hypothetical protein